MRAVQGDYHAANENNERGGNGGEDREDAFYALSVTVLDEQTEQQRRHHRPGDACKHVVKGNIHARPRE